MKKITHKLLGKELRNSKMGWVPGMALTNASGDVDSGGLGYQYTIQTTTAIRARTTMQKFYKVPPADFMSVVIGTGAWLEDIKTNQVYQVGGAFESGIISTASGPAQIGQVDVGTKPVTTALATWAKGYQYSTPELQKALASNNWDVVAAKMEALKNNWDLGIQKVAFLGLKNDLTNFPGLYTNAGVTANTAIITAAISGLSSADFQTLVKALLAAYVSNTNFTAMPNTFVLPLSDFLGMGAAASPDFPINSKLDYLLKAFQQVTGNANFQIKATAYGNSAQNAGYVSASGKNRYILYNNDPETLAMDIPVDFQLSPAGTNNNFNWQGVGFGQFAGPTIYRKLEVMYFDYA